MWKDLQISHWYSIWKSEDQKARSRRQFYSVSGSRGFMSNLRKYAWWCHSDLIRVTYTWALSRKGIMKYLITFHNRKSIQNLARTREQKSGYLLSTVVLSVLPPRPGLSLLSYPSNRLSRILVKVVMSLKLRVELESALDLNKRWMCNIICSSHYWHW